LVTTTRTSSTILSLLSSTSPLRPVSKVCDLVRQKYKNFFIPFRRDLNIWEYFAQLLAAGTIDVYPEILVLQSYCVPIPSVSCFPDPPWEYYIKRLIVLYKWTLEKQSHELQSPGPCRLVISWLRLYPFLFKILVKLSFLQISKLIDICKSKMLLLKYNYQIRIRQGSLDMFRRATVSELQRNCFCFWTFSDESDFFVNFQKIHVS
jgi:hypothetical protein